MSRQDDNGIELQDAALLDSQGGAPPTLYDDGDGSMAAGDTRVDTSPDGDMDETIDTEVVPPRTLNLRQGVSFIVGLMVGSGIFASPGVVTDNVKSVPMSIIIWLLAGILSGMGAVSYAELGTMIPKSGGEYAYFTTTFNAQVAFIFSWTQVAIIKPGSQAIIALVFGRYLATLLYNWDPATLPEDIDMDWRVKSLAIVCVFLILVINSISVKAAAHLQVVSSILKFAGLILIMIIGLCALVFTDNDNFGKNMTFSGSSNDASNYGLALIAALWSYDGWNNLNIVAGELQNPSRNLPRAIWIGVPSVALFYVAVNLAYAAVLPLETLRTSAAIAVETGETLGFMKHWGGKVVTLCVVVSTFGACNGSAFTGARVLQASAADNQFLFPGTFSKLHRTRRTPINALVLEALISSSLLALGDFRRLVNYYSFASWVFYGLAVLCVPILRWRQPQMDRPYRTSLVFPPAFALVSVFLVGNVFYRQFIECLVALVFILSSIPAHYLLQWWLKRQQTSQGRPVPLATAE